MSLASGRYMETIGWMSTYSSPCVLSRVLTSASQGVKGVDEESSQPLEFSRRYLDQNRNTVRDSSFLPATRY